MRLKRNITGEPCISAPTKMDRINGRSGIIHIHDTAGFLEAMLLFTLCIWLFKQAINATTTFDIPFPDQFESIMAVIVIIIVAAKTILMIGRNGSLDQDTYSKRNPRNKAVRDRIVGRINGDQYLFASLLIAALYGYSWVRGRYGSLLLIAAFTMGLVGVSARKVLGCYLFAVGSAVSAAMLSAMSGGIPNLVYVGGQRIRSSWGILYPTDFSAIILYLCLIAFVYLKEVPDASMLLLAFVPYVISDHITEGLNSRACSILLIIFIILMMIEKAMMECAAWKKTAFLLSKTADILLQAAFPCLAFLMVFLTWAYKKRLSFSIVLNNAIHGRLATSVRALEDHGLHAFGSRFEQIGHGGTTFSNLKGSDFIDSSYALVLFRYGWVILLMYCILWAWLTHRAVRAGDRRLAIALAIIAVHSFEEQHFLEFNYNIFLLCPFTDLLALSSSGRERDTLKGWIQRWRMTSKDRRSAASAAAVSIFLGTLAAPIWMSMSRTACSLARTMDDAGHRTILLISMILTVWSIAAVLKGAVDVFSIAAHRIKQDKGQPINCKRTTLLLFSLGIIFLLAEWAVVSVTIEHGLGRSPDKNGTVYVRSDYPQENPETVRYGTERTLPTYKEIIDGEQGIISLMAGASPGRIFISDVPELYRRVFRRQGLSYIGLPFLNGEDLARSADTTVITPVETDSNCFIGTGFLYARISPYHSVYTNDRDVIEALDSHGIRLTGYCSVEKGAVLQALADLNGLGLKKTNGDMGDGILIDSPARSVISGPSVDLYPGKYTVQWDLELSEANEGGAGMGETAPDTPDDIVCRVYVKAYEGEKVIRDAPVYRSQLNNAEKKLISGIFSSGSYQSVEFPVVAEEGYSLILKSLTWKRTPDQDVHAIYDSRRRKIREEFYDSDGKAILTSDGYQSVDYGYDKADNVISKSYYGIDGEPVTVNGGYARITNLFDRKKQKLKESYFDTDGNPIAIKDGYASIEWEYDRNGNPTVTRYFGTDGTPVTTSYGYAELHREYDDDHRIIKESYHDIDGQGIRLGNGQAGELREYDENDNVICVTYIDEEGESSKTKAGYVSIRRVFNEARQVISESYIDADGLPVAVVGGVSSTSKEYDGGGRTSRTAFFDVDGNSLITTGGYAAWRKEYDDAGNVVDELYYDTDGDPVACSSGFAEIKREYDDKRQCIEERYFDKDGKAVSCTDGYFGIQRRFDEDGRTIRQTFIDAEGYPMYSFDRYSTWVRTYDEEDNPVKEEYLGLEGQKVLNSSGISEIHRTYDDRHLCIKETYHGLEAERVLNTSGYSEVRRVFDEDKLCIEETYHGLEGELVIRNNGYAIIRRSYNEDGKTIREERYGTKEEPVAPDQVFAIGSEYNDRGQIIETDYYGDNGDLVQNGNNIAGIRYGYDEMDNRFEDTYLGTDGKEAIASNGVCIIRRKYLFRRAVEERYFDMKGDAVLCTDGYHGIDRIYDQNGNQVSWTYVDISGDAVNAESSGIATVERGFDGARNVISERFLDAEGKPVQNTSGIASIQREFDSERKTIREERLDLGGNVIP